MIALPCRFQPNKSIEVDTWGHGVRLRIIDRVAETKRTLFLDAYDVARLVDAISQSAPHQLTDLRAARDLLNKALGD